MTTLAELKTQAATLLFDPENKTFDSTALGYFINAGIAEVSRIAPARFIEDIQCIADTVSYPVRGGDGNLVANPSFEAGDSTLFDGYVTVAPGDSELTGGWEPSASVGVHFTRSSNAKSGQYVGLIKLPAATATKYLYQDIPVSAGSTYQCSGWHWKTIAGGEASIVQFHTLDSGSVVVTTDAVRHDTTAATPQSFSGTITVPDDGTVSYIRVAITAYSAGAGSEQVSAFEDISVFEQGQGGLVATNSLDQIEVTDVELWSSEDDPVRFASRLTPHWESFVTHSEGGWRYWDGRLRIPYRVIASLGTSVASYFLRVRGYAPYTKLTSASQTTDLSFELEQGIMKYVQVAALERLLFERDLFTQWQARAGNTDISPASLMNNLSLAREDWRRFSRAIATLREG